MIEKFIIFSIFLHNLYSFNMDVEIFPDDKSLVAFTENERIKEIEQSLDDEFFIDDEEANTEIIKFLKKLFGNKKELNNFLMQYKESIMVPIIEKTSDSFNGYKLYINERINSMVIEIQRMYEKMIYEIMFAYRNKAYDQSAILLSCYGKIVNFFNKKHASLTKLLTNVFAKVLQNELINNLPLYRTQFTNKFYEMWKSHQNVYEDIEYESDVDKKLSRSIFNMVDKND